MKGSAGALGRLNTDLGERSTYDAASQCSRCGYCEQACPTYVVTGEEAKSGRGRNQLVRMMLEGRFQDVSAAAEALSTCLLCGACTAACYAHVPTADLVLEGRRMLRGGKSRWLVRVLSDLVENRPELFVRLLRAANLLKRLGVSGLVSKSRALRLFGLRWLEEVERHVEEAPRIFLFEYLRGDADLRPPRGRTPAAPRPRWAYFAPCGPNYLYPRVGLATVSALKKRLGRGVFLENPCCGLLFYNYGDLEAARRIARRNIENYEAKAREIDRAFPAAGAGVEGSSRGLQVFGDCSSCVAHLKSYPQLFLEDPALKPRAEAFSRNVRDVIELAPTPAPRSAGGGREEGAASREGGADGRSWTYHDSCRARNGEGLASQPRELLRAACAGAYRELPEAGWCCGGAGVFAFAEPELSDAVLRRKIGHIASVQARRVATSSTSCLIQIARGLKKYYPECRVVHVSELLEERLERGAGTEPETAVSHG